MTLDSLQRRASEIETESNISLCLTLIFRRQFDAMSV